MREDRGSMLLETVAAMPLLIALTFGALQLAHIHVARQITAYAAYAAARAALPVEEGDEQEAAEHAARRILCWLAAAPESKRDGVLMPDPDAKCVKDRLLLCKIGKEDQWSREVELKFAFPLVFPLAAQIIGKGFNPTDYTSQKRGSHITEKTFGDAFEGPHLILHERMRLVKPYIVKN